MRVPLVITRGVILTDEAGRHVATLDGKGGAVVLRVGASPGGPAVEIVAAEKFASVGVLDEHGTARGMLMFATGGAVGVGLSDDAGQLRAQLGLDAAGVPAVALADAAGQTVACLGLGPLPLGQIPGGPCLGPQPEDSP